MANIKKRFQFCSAKHFDMSELLTVFLDSPGKLEPLSPSRLNRELQMPLEERLRQLCRPTRKYRLYDEKCGVSKTPDIVVFQNFELCQEYKTTVTIQNKQKVSKCVRVETAPSPYFRLSRVEASGVKVAPGMTFTISLSFAPRARQDYFYEIVVVTADGKSTIPVHALGPRPILNIPDSITVPPTAVRVPSTQSILLQNIGQVATSYAVTCKEPFRVSPSRSEVSPNEFNEVQVTCLPRDSCQSLNSQVYFHFASMECVVRVECEVTDVDVSFDDPNVLFDEVYMGLKTHKSLELINKSNYALSFSWRRNESFRVDEAEKSKVIRAAKANMEIQKVECARLEYNHVVDSEEHSMILERRFGDDVGNLEQQEFLYSSKYFSIIPMEGEVLPKQKFTFTVIFSPTEATSYTSCAYLDVTGKTERLPVSFVGHGKGPKVVFNTQVVNLNDIYLSTNNEYEIIVKNVGEIPATVAFDYTPMDFGGVLNCFPATLCLSFNGDCKIFLLRFHTEHKGYFIEKVQFLIQESMERLSFLITGNVQCPHLQTDVKEIDFGEISYGQQITKTFNLMNPTKIPVDFSVSIDDGVVCYEVEPKSGVVEPLSEKPITIFTQALEHTTPEIILSVYSCAGRERTVQIPISYHCVQPDIECEYKEIEINFGFVDVPYKRLCRLRNKTQVHFELSYHPEKLPPGFHCTLNVEQFKIRPLEETEIHLEIHSETLGSFDYPLNFIINGCMKKTLCQIICHINGPVIVIEPMELNFGYVRLLTEVTRTLKVINDSPIPASLELNLGVNSCLKADVDNLDVPRDSEKTIQFKMFLTQIGPIKELVNINVKGGETLKVYVLAHGMGLPIWIEPKLDPEYDVGTQLTYKEFKLPVTYTNLGKKPYKILITRHTLASRQLHVRKSVIMAAQTSTFEVRPSQFDLYHNQAVTFEMVAMVKRPKIVSEDYNCFMTALKSTKLNLIASFVIKANFVDPFVTFSASSLQFQIGRSPDEELKSIEKIGLIYLEASNPSIMPSNEETSSQKEEVQVSTEPQDEKSVCLENSLDLKLALTITTTKSFYIMSGNKLETTVNINMEQNSKINVPLLFKPDLVKKRADIIKGELQVHYALHPKTDILPLVGEVCYPTVSIPEEYDFGSVPPGGYTTTHFLLKNLTLATVKYSWRFLEEESEFEQLAELREPLKARTTRSALSIDSSRITITEFSDVYEVYSVSNQLIKNRISVNYLNQLSIRQSIQSQLSSSTASRSDWPQDTSNRDELKNVMSNFLPDVGVCDEFFDDGGPDECPYDLIDWRDVLSVEPRFGVLEPFEHCSVNLMFNPPANVRIKAVLECSCEGGETERMVVRGISSTISYKLDKQYVEYGHKLYNEICEGKLTLTNTSYGPVTVKIACDPHHPVATAKPRWLNVTPVEKTLNSKDKVTFTVKYFPGVTGEFKKKFEMSIEYLEKIPIYVHGYATFSQVTAQLKRPSMEEYAYVNYRAISDISFSYLKSLETYNKLLCKHSVKLPTDVPLTDVKWFLMNSWVILPKNNLYPSSKVIDLATERMLFNDHLMTVGVSSSAPRTGRWSDFRVPPYELDLGAVAVGSSLCYTVQLVNNGPNQTEVKLLKDSCGHLERDEISIEFQGGSIEVGETQKLYVVFKPSKKRYGTSEESFVKNKFELKVKNGGVVPVLISAIVAWPRVHLERNEVHFSDVGLGQAVRRSIVLNNDGYITSRWSTEIISHIKVLRNNFVVIPDKGKLAPNTTTMLNIYFIPNQLGQITCNLNVSVEGNNKKTVLKLVGSGYEPCIVINSPFLKFKTILPYNSASISFNLQNLSSFAMEYSFSDFDKEYEEEKYMIHAYLMYKKLYTLLAPKREIGEKLTDIFQGNFHFLMAQVMQQLMHTANSDGKETDDLNHMNEFSVEEMYNLIKGYIEATHTENDTTKTDSLFPPADDDFNALSNIGILVAEKSSKTTVELCQKGLFIIFHGAPFTEYYKMSNKCGKVFALPVYSVDRLIYEELAANECVAAQTLNKSIDDIIESTFPDIISSPEEDDYDFIQRKFEAIDSFREITKKIHKSEKGSTFNLPTDLFNPIMKKKLDRFPAGVIVESLDSTVLPKTEAVLECLLSACKDRYVHLIVLHNIWENYEKDKRFLDDSRLSRPRRSEGKISAKSSKNSRMSAAVSSENFPKQRRVLSRRSSIGFEFYELKKTKKAFEQFQTTLEQLLNYCEFWDKQQCMLATSSLDRRNSGGKYLRHSTGSQRRKSLHSFHSAVNFTITENGVPLWIYHNANADNWEEQCSTIITALKQDPEVIKVTAPHIEAPDEESSAEYTVYRFCNRKKKTGCGVFEIFNVEGPKEKEVSSISGNKRHKRIIKRSLKPNVAPTVKSVKPFQPRTIISSGKTESYRVTFSPKTTGVFKCEYVIDTIGFTNSVTIQCEAICQIPQIDFTPEKVFVNVLDNIALKSVHDNFVYVKDKNTFYFGPILIGGAKTPPYRTKFHLRNNSRLPCFVTAFMDELSMFSYRQPANVISPGSDLDLEVQVKPVKRQLIQTSLFVTIENNPKVYHVKLQAKPCLMEFDVHPKSLTFDKIPVQTSSTKKLHLKNGCLVDLWWRLDSKDPHLMRTLKVSPTSGALKAYTTDEIFVEYRSEVAEDLKVDLEMLIFDLNCSGTVPFQIETISIHARAVQYLAECNNHINLEDIKGRTLHKCSFTVYNKGKYSIFLNVQIVDINDENKPIRKCFKLMSIKPLKPIEIPPDKGLTVHVHCQFPRELTINSLPIYLCHLTEVPKIKSGFKSFFVRVSAQVFLSKYEICPPSRLYFGHLEISYQKLLRLELKNVGKFPFSFHLESVTNKDSSAIRATSNSRESRRGSSFRKDRKDFLSQRDVSRARSKSKNERRLKLSCFNIYPVSGEVQPNSSVFLQVDCKPEETVEYSEVMKLYVSEPPKEYPDGEEIRLQATGAEARLDLTRKRIIFKEHFIVKRFDDFIPPDKIDAHTVYASTEQTLYFSRVCINTEKSVNIYLTNISQVSAKITTTLDQLKNFSVCPPILNIVSSNMEPLSITFKPTAIGVFKNKLQLSYNRREENVYQLNLVGRSCVPQIKLLGLNPDQTNTCEIYLPLCYIGEKQSYRISVQNIGEIPCKVILDMRDNQKEYFGLQVCEDSLKYLNKDLPDFKRTKCTTLINLKTLEIGSFKVTFSANEEVRCETLLKVHTVNNPFEMFNIKIYGQSYYSEVLIKDLPVILYQRFYLSYQIDFGNIFLSTLYTKRFFLRNNSEEKFFRFEFTTLPPLMIIPKVGHLAPGRVKQIVAAVYSKSIQNLENELLELRYKQISYLSPEDAEKNWDERHDYQFFEQSIHEVQQSTESEVALEIGKAIKKEERMQSVDLTSNESDIVHLEKEYRIIPVLFSMNTNYAIYECETTEIIFPLTRVDEEVSREFKVKNEGSAPINIEWSFVEESRSPSGSSNSLLGAIGQSTMPQIQIETPREDIHRSYSDLTLFSSTFIHPIRQPFSIEPQKSTILAGNAAVFALTFAPVDQSSYSYCLRTEIPSLSPLLEPLRIGVRARSEFPEFYFELEPSDLAYVSKKGLGDSDAKVVQFESVGVGTVSKKSFNLVNHYEETVAFEFTPKYRTNFSCFACKDPSGTIEPYKKFEVSFRFTPLALGVFEEKHVFSLRDKSFRSTFTLIGTCREPKVSFTMPHVTLPNTAIGMESKGKLYLRNDEDVPMAFKFVKDCLVSDSGDQKLVVSPVSGKLLEKGDTVVDISCEATAVGLFSFVLKCCIGKARYIMTNVSLTCMEVMSSLWYMKEGKRVEIHHSRDNIIDVGNIPLNKMTRFKIYISNVGETGFYFTWVCNKKGNEDLNVDVPEGRFVPSYCTTISFVQITPFKRKMINNLKFGLQISHGKTYVLRVNGLAKSTLCKFSFTSYDFQYCVVQKRKTKTYRVDLGLKNLENSSVMVENSFENNSSLTVALRSVQIPVNSSITIPIYFHPHTVGVYTFHVPILVDSANFVIKIRGEAILPNIQLLQANDKCIDLGRIRVDTVKRHVVPVVNRSPTVVTAVFNTIENLPSQKIGLNRLESDFVILKGTDDSSPLKRRKSVRLSDTVSDQLLTFKNLIRRGSRKSKDTLHSDYELNNSVAKMNLIKDVLTVLPKEPLEMEINKKYEFTLELCSKERMSRFSETIYFEVNGDMEPLCIIKGSFIAPMFSMDKKFLTFPNVVVGYKCSKSVLLMNKGDISGRYRLSFAEPTNIFSVGPDEGLLKSKVNRTIMITFAPTTLQCQFENKLLCHIDDLPPLELIVCGSSIALPEAKEKLEFSAPVYQTNTRQIFITNPTVSNWRLTTRHTSNYWNIVKYLDIPPESCTRIKLDFTPLYLLPEPIKDNLYIELPDGQVMLYQLVGNVLPPLPAGVIYNEVHSKTWHFEVLEVQNKHNVKQFFKVTTELVGQISPKSYYKTSGLELIEVLPNNRKDYIWQVYIINAVPMEFKVTFTMTDTTGDSQDYTFFKIILDVLPPLPLDTIVLETTVREQVKGTIQLSNPLAVPVSFELSCDSPEVITEKSITLDAYSTYRLQVLYCPLESEARLVQLEATSEELGECLYMLRLIAHAPPLEEKIVFEAELGERCSNFAELSNEFGIEIKLTAEFDNPVFSMEKPLVIEPGKTGKFVVTFEPTNIGDFQGIGTLTSAETGSYTYPLLGKCTPPTPKGPFLAKPNDPANITFTNPFTERYTFEFKSLSKYFKARPKSEELEPQNSAKIVVSVSGPNTKYPTTGKLIVTCDDPSKKDLVWTFYLHSKALE